ncbi:hypothetical protein [Marinitenerispora sediminis]|uniref:Uncharacterized protein n=1 Tax=Marinitenerispora sediminis TaxID=1931232 RepID=A0A368TA56_9ACTN|nr:hypothetical protein [Marinitenerispora sediminis]RCV52963.1 hypothetical protein DEF28_11545 [Marinitenerispora sediminis]RCV58442.1 hypothetical protein DEF23_09015 [Marinitenerispora sediminis]RCV61778.1 hypothetical protein DEF24_03350 [Marinitenerispora sediminis]
MSPVCARGGPSALGKRDPPNRQLPDERRAVLAQRLQAAADAVLSGLREVAAARPRQTSPTW